MADIPDIEEPCSTCILRKGDINASPIVRKATFGSWHHALYYCGRDFLCHETRDDGGTKVCAGFLRFKRARERNPNFRPRTVEDIASED
jgi:hypothetical protein